jgi:hypothetical protein
MCNHALLVPNVDGQIDSPFMMVLVGLLCIMLCGQSFEAKFVINVPKVGI